MVKRFVEQLGRLGPEMKDRRSRGTERPLSGDTGVWLAAELSILGQMRPSIFASRIMLSVEQQAA
jgi:hypothetical protein